ncbi:MAG: ComF family protein, partial [Epulopiscium sp.]|nr:ComF family protein [Candidatus Epulonipiscium sp.]
ENMYSKLKDTGFFHQIDLIIPVPVSKERLEERGYNQAEEIAKHLSKISKIPYNRDILIRKKDTRPQSGFNPNQRTKNIRNAFVTTSQLPAKHKVILIIDDIYTTGSTINECSRILLNSGAEKTYSSVVCIGS